ncbi:PREDICTED: sodium/potassium-transporting ATPase subunit beta-1-like [Nicrophorus vespilloides]|uniref:Sodium/potassium-transporting ATPase subunit beta-1-like n=1 Tax=Nicrophorus vespilloides TaxID=110193 RepID=A0ABM1NBT5_NICVS|nr:PREDICTED: sodium/potassium-transporting ATPase subunit beta-1-like [Nicrophorus vespilloides]
MFQSAIAIDDLTFGSWSMGRPRSGRRNRSRHAGCRRCCSKECCGSCCRYLYNPKQHTFCTRTCGSWCKILTYYIGFIICITAIFLLMIYLETDSKGEMINPNVFKIKLLDVGIPGGSLLPSSANNLSLPLIWLTKSSKGPSSNTYIHKIQTFLKTQNEKCKELEKTGMRKCPFNLTELGPCAEPQFGYDNKKPCIYLKLNRLLSWTPTAYTKSDLNKLEEKYRRKVDISRSVIWVHCEGESTYDEEHLGTIKYHPEAAFHEKYFPFEQAVSLNPVIAIQLGNVQSGYILHIRCTLFSKNFPYSGNSVLKTFVLVD